jgi:protein O-GlcNAc transferase
MPLRSGSTLPTPAPTAQAAQRFNTANADFKAGRWTDALSGFDAVLLDAPQLAAAHLGRARCLVKRGDWMPAREAFAAVLRLEPANYSAWLESGHLCRQMGEMAQSLAAYQRALAVDGQRHEAWLGLTRTLEQSGRFDEAASTLAEAQRTAAQTSPTTLRSLWQLLGKYRLERGDLPRALSALRTALALARDVTDPVAQVDEVAEICMDIAELLLRDNQHDRAMPLLTEASASERESTLARLSETAFRYNLWQEAIAVSRRALALHPKSAWAHWNLAHLLAQCWQMSEAEVLLQQAEALAPMPGAQTMRGQMAGRLGDADRALGHYQAHFAKHPKDRSIASSMAMCALYCDSLNASQVSALTRELFAPLGEGARIRESFVRAPLVGADGKHRRVKLGLVSADFHFQHPVNIFMQPVLRELDRTRFEVFVYFTGVSSDAQTHLAKTRAEHWFEATHLNDRQLAKQIDADAIDILMDLSGHTGHNRMGMFAQRAAPVQATYLGYPGSTGLPNMDWLIGDSVVTPAAHAGLYSERVARLPGTVFCFAPEVDYPYPNYAQTHADRPLTFGSFNNVPKLTPHTLKLWARILAALPESRLILKAPSFADSAAQAVFLERFTALGVAATRIEFRGPVGLTDMMAEYADIDIALDPVPYNGGTTTLQAMWMGAPVVVKEGAHFVSRMGASFMRAAGLDDWVAADDEAYVAIARDKGRDRQALLKLKLGLRERLLERPAWNVVAHTRELERALHLMYTQFAQFCDDAEQPYGPSGDAIGMGRA